VPFKVLAVGVLHDEEGTVPALIIGLYRAALAAMREKPRIFEAS
jgi:hypothetical protein